MTRRTLADVRKLSAEMGPRHIPETDGVLGNLHRSFKEALEPDYWVPRYAINGVYLFELDRLPLVWTPEDVARVMRRPKIDLDSDDEYEVAERMAVLWMQYAQEMKR